MVRNTILSASLAASLVAALPTPGQNDVPFDSTDVCTVSARAIPFVAEANLIAAYEGACSTGEFNVAPLLKDVSGKSTEPTLRITEIQLQSALKLKCQHELNNFCLANTADGLTNAAVAPLTACVKKTGLDYFNKGVEGTDLACASDRVHDAASESDGLLDILKRHHSAPIANLQSNGLAHEITEEDKNPGVLGEVLGLESGHEGPATFVNGIAVHEKRQGGSLLDGLLGSAKGASKGASPIPGILRRDQIDADPVEVDDVDENPGVLGELLGLESGHEGPATFVNGIAVHEKRQAGSLLDGLLGNDANVDEPSLHHDQVDAVNVPSGLANFAEASAQTTSEDVAMNPNGVGSSVGPIPKRQVEEFSDIIDPIAVTASGITNFADTAGDGTVADAANILGGDAVPVAKRQVEQFSDIVDPIAVTASGITNFADTASDGTVADAANILGGDAVPVAKREVPDDLPFEDALKPAHFAADATIAVTDAAADAAILGTDSTRHRITGDIGKRQVPGVAEAVEAAHTAGLDNGRGDFGSLFDSKNHGDIVDGAAAAGIAATDFAAAAGINTADAGFGIARTAGAPAGVKRQDDGDDELDNIASNAGAAGINVLDSADGAIDTTADGVAAIGHLGDIPAPASFKRHIGPAAGVNEVVKDSGLGVSEVVAQAADSVSDTADAVLPGKRHIGPAGGVNEAVKESGLGVSEVVAQAADSVSDTADAVLPGKRHIGPAGGVNEAVKESGLGVSEVVAQAADSVSDTADAIVPGKREVGSIIDETSAARHLSFGVDSFDAESFSKTVVDNSREKRQLNDNDIVSNAGAAGINVLDSADGAIDTTADGVAALGHLGDVPAPAGFKRSMAVVDPATRMVKVVNNES